MQLCIDNIFIKLRKLRGHPCKNQTKMKFLWQGSSCTQVDPSRKRKAVYFFSSNMFLFSRKTNFSLSPSRIDGSGHNRSKIEHFCSLCFSKILHQGKSNQSKLFHRLFVSFESYVGIGCLEAFGYAKKQCVLFRYKKFR